MDLLVFILYKHCISVYNYLVQDKKHQRRSNQMTNASTIERVTATGRTVQKNAFEAKREVNVHRYTRANKCNQPFRCGYKHTERLEKLMLSSPTLIEDLNKRGIKQSIKHRAIWSPCCDETVVVGHFSWSALICPECGAEVGKYSWLTL